MDCHGECNSESYRISNNLEKRERKNETKMTILSSEVQWSYPSDNRPTRFSDNRISSIRDDRIRWPKRQLVPVETPIDMDQMDFYDVNRATGNGMYKKLDSDVVRLCGIANDVTYIR